MARRLLLLLLGAVVAGLVVVGHHLQPQIAFDALGPAKWKVGSVREARKENLGNNSHRSSTYVSLSKVYIINKFTVHCQFLQEKTSTQSFEKASKFKVHKHKINNENNILLSLLELLHHVVVYLRPLRRPVEGGPGRVQHGEDVVVLHRGRVVDAVAQTRVEPGIL